MTEPDPAAPPQPQGLQQITMKYAWQQDRLLLALLDSDNRQHRFWLTRRFVRGLWAALLRILENYPSLKGYVDDRVRQAVLSMRHMEAVQQADFATPARPAAAEPGAEAGDTEPDGAEMPDAALLLGATGTVLSNGSTRFTFKAEGGRELQVTMNEQLLHAFCHLLIEVTAKADWDLDLRVGNGNVVLPEGDQPVH